MPPNFIVLGCLTVRDNYTIFDKIPLQIDDAITEMSVYSNGKPFDELTNVTIISST